jgi:hypothetical protein
VSVVVMTHDPAFVALALSMVDTLSVRGRFHHMIALRAVTPSFRAESRAVTRTLRGSVRSWTGRSVVTSATSRVRPRFATAGMHRTRVSEMRDSASRTGIVRSFRALAAPLTTSSLRRRPFSPLTSG